MILSWDTAETSHHHSSKYKEDLGQKISEICDRVVLLFFSATPHLGRLSLAHALWKQCLELSSLFVMFCLEHSVSIAQLSTCTSKATPHTYDFTRVEAVCEGRNNYQELPFYISLILRVCITSWNKFLKIVCNFALSLVFLNDEPIVHHSQDPIFLGFAPTFVCSL